MSTEKLLCSDGCELPSKNTYKTPMLHIQYDNPSGTFQLTILHPSEPILEKLIPFLVHIHIQKHRFHIHMILFTISHDMILYTYCLTGLLLIYFSHNYVSFPFLVTFWQLQRQFFDELSLYFSPIADITMLSDNHIFLNSMSSLSSVFHFRH